MQIRMGSRLAYRLDCPPELLAEPFPPMLLQTLVENSIKHGLEPSADPGKVVVTARVDPDPDAVLTTLRITVADTGVGFGNADTGGTGIGLANVREQLHSLFGDKAELIISPNAPTGVIATLVVPRVTPNQTH
jgi:LytS/YehU family sensor histidine kinase